MENENINVTAETYDREATELDYRKTWMPQIHKIGPITMVIGALLMFVPGLFMYFVMGWNEVPFSSIIAFAAFVLPMMGINQFTEHLQFYPLMGASGIYMGYLAGSCATLRLPVAQSCVNASGDDVLSAKGQLAATIGVATTIVSNIIILLLITVFGNFMLKIIPVFVKDALGLITYAIFGYLLCMNLSSQGKGNIAKGLAGSWMWMALGIAFRFVFNAIPALKNFAALCVLLSCLVCAIIWEKMQDKKEAA
ncbi:MAG: hypothetical protein HUJ80_08375 [Firmicutes bacterium]|nr:hypothetical protein [Bacillota bacterium]